MSDLDELLAAAAKHQGATGELRYLRSVEQWALGQQPIAGGDTVRVRKSLVITQDSGWWPYRECLAPGAIGTVSSVAFNGYYGYWYASFVPDVQWTRTYNGTRYDKAPDRLKTFMVNVKHLKKVTP